MFARVRLRVSLVRNKEEAAEAAAAEEEEGKEEGKEGGGGGGEFVGQRKGGVWQDTRMSDGRKVTSSESHHQPAEQSTCRRLCVRARYLTPRSPRFSGKLGANEE